MKQSQYRQLPAVAVFVLAVLLGVTACSKHKADNADATKVEASVPEKTLTPEEQALKQQDVEKHPDDYYKADNKERVAEENGLLDDVNSKK